VQVSGQVGFRNWLLEQRRLSPKAASDVVSRLKRAYGLIDLKPGFTEDFLVSQVTQLEQWEAIPPSSQLSMLRAIRLHFEYLRS